jgi:hypothetical protein
MEHLFPSHASCWDYEPLLVALHTLADALIALAYFAIPAALFYLARKYRVKKLSSVLLLFGLFILLCGTTHIFDVVTVWRGGYRLYLADGIVRALTGVVSAAAAVVTVRCAAGALVGFSRLVVLERRAAARIETLESDPRFGGDADREWSQTLRELHGLVERVVSYAPPEQGRANE